MEPNINLLDQTYVTNRIKQISTKTNTIIALVAILINASIISTAVIYVTKAKPSQPLSPTPYTDKPKIVRQSLTDQKQSLAYYIAKSQKYLDQAREYADRTKQNQTQSDKQKIITLLNESLRSATNAIKYYPNQPEGWQQRAKLYRAMSVIDPSAKTKAQQDLAIAKKLSPNSKPPKITPQDIIRSQPTQEASLAKNIIIASPDDNKSTSIKSDQDSNGKKGTVILKAGQKTITIHSKFVTKDNLIYFTPDGDTNNEIISLKTKSFKDKSFTLEISNPLNHDLKITWWILE